MYCVCDVLCDDVWVVALCFDCVRLKRVLLVMYCDVGWSVVVYVFVCAWRSCCCLTCVMCL